MSLALESTISELYEELSRRGLTLKVYAQQRGWKPMTVQQVVYRYWGRKDEPRGRLSYEILTNLREFIASQN